MFSIRNFSPFQSKTTTIQITPKQRQLIFRKTFNATSPFYDSKGRKDQTHDHPHANSTPHNQHPYLPSWQLAMSHHLRSNQKQMGQKSPSK